MATTSPPSPTVDLLVLTFNCAKNPVNVPVFADHLHAALRKNASGLPDLVVLSLQEVAPLSYAFIGGYFLAPYLARFEEAVNLAAARHGNDDDDDGQQDGVPATPTTTAAAAAPSSNTSKAKPYTLVRAKNVGYTAIVLLARDPARLRNIQEAEVGFGAAEMGNKGAVGLRMLYEGQGDETTELTFVATHLAAMEWNLPRRNANWAAIMRGMAFENPEDVVESFRTNSLPLSTASSSSDTLQR
ncbi:hypothetical protein G7046_g9669 [Stylonectria norvegica]|nr:hypothetical protein G7046_g9669 [Stylonectria norvegica]